jgi:signal peptidase I
MMPTFKDSDKIVVTKISEIQRFDLIVFHSPVSEDDHIKRVIGLSGDRIEVTDDILSVNGKVYQEPYLIKNKDLIPSEENLTQNFKLNIPKGSLFVMGDNRRNSVDSRIYGVVSENSIVGEVKLRFYPFKELGIPK